MRAWLVLASVAALLVAGCGRGGDPFEEGPWDIKLQNDTARFVVVNDCTTQACTKFWYTKRLAPRRSVAALDYGDGTSWWVVSSHGKRLGCLTLGISNRVEGYVLRVSSLRRCPSPK